MYGSVLLCFHQQLFNEMQIKIIINLNSTIVLGMKLAIIFIIKLRSTLQNAWKTIFYWKIIIFNLVGFLLFYFIIFYEKRADFIGPVVFQATIGTTYNNIRNSATTMEDRQIYDLK